KAARQGSTDAQLNLAELEMAPGPGRDFADAARWLRPLARHGNALAQRWLGDLYAAGHGVIRNPQRAYMWYWLAGRRDPTAAPRMRRQGRQLTAAQRRAARRRARRWLAANARK
ncbi:MAG: tetratricopeptide repeat protein, partial [Terriglobales bacterium]